jgi:hypothetical protein
LLIVDLPDYLDSLGLVLGYWTRKLQLNPHPLLQAHSRLEDVEAE